MNVETLIVGAGPVGLFLATELLRHGRACAIIEQNTGPSMHSKALAIMPRTFEIFEMAGLGPVFAEAINRIDGVRLVTPRTQLLVEFDRLRSEFCYVGILPQWKTEALLAQRVRELGGEIRYGHALEGLVERDNALCARVGTAAGTQEIVARYVVGCDGVRSAVRSRAGIAFEGTTYEEAAVLADATVHTAIPTNEAHVHLHAQGVVTLFPMGGLLRRIVVIAPAQPMPERADAAWLQQQLDDAGYHDALVAEPQWSSSFRVHSRVARAMRAGGIFLAGDAAHTHSPVGGQGMNIGLHDAWNLGWKLAYVQSGRAAATLLDSYERERLPVARNVVRRTDLLTHALAHAHPIARAARDRLAPLVARAPWVYDAIVRGFSQLDVPYAKRAANVRLADGTHLYERLGRSPIALREGSGRERVIRPDGYVASPPIRRQLSREAFEVLAE